MLVLVVIGSDCGPRGWKKYKIRHFCLFLDCLIPWLALESHSKILEFTLYIKKSVKHLINKCSDDSTGPPQLSTWEFQQSIEIGNFSAKRTVFVTPPNHIPLSQFSRTGRFSFVARNNHANLVQVRQISPLSQLEFMSYIKLRLRWNLCST